ncbi:hypothetical protein PSTT_11665, partial [Puccinia striiformis]
MSSSNLTGIYGGSDDPCILGYTNGTYPNGTLGKGNWRRYGVYMPSAAEKAACQAPNDPWVWTQYYGWWTTYFIMVGVVAVSLVNGIKRLHNLNRIMGLPSIIYHHPKVSALFRMGSYPALKFLRVELPPLGPAIFLFGFLTYSTLVCFLRRPFLPTTALWRITIVSVSKESWISTKWAPWICLYMSILHTWTMIIRIERQQPWHYTITHNKLYWNGFPPLLALGWLCVMSLGPIRSLIFLIALASDHVHLALIPQSGPDFTKVSSSSTWSLLLSFSSGCTFTWKTSWIHGMHAATVLWAAGILWRLVAYTLDHGWFSRVPRATIEALPANAVRLRIPVPSSRQWSAGSYVYLRFPSIKPWESHPFTISTLPTPSHNGTEGNEMVFVLRPRQGLTARLKTLADMPTLPAIRACLIDGPYGGFMDSLRACDTVLLVAGGTGMAALISIAQSLQRSGPARGMSCCTALEIHWAIRDSVCLEWFRKQLSEIESVKIYVTNETQPLQSDQNTAEIKEQEKEQVEIEEQEQGNVGIEEQEKKTSLTPTLRSRTHYNRPNLPEVIGAAAGRYAGRIGVMVCGPTSMVTEVRSTVAQLQKSILLSKKNVKCNELELYQESFDD